VSDSQEVISEEAEVDYGASMNAYLQALTKFQ
jgi:hypothetical protein